MSLYKRGKTWHTIVVVNGIYYRESLGTTDKREAKTLEHERIEQLKKRAPDPQKRGKSYGSMNLEAAMKAYIAERRGQVSPRMVAYWQEQERSLSAYFKTLKLARINSAHIADFQRSRLDLGRAPKTINGAVSVLRQLLKNARLWNRVAEDYKPVRNTKPPVGRALALEEQKRLFETAALWKSESALTRVGKDGKTYKLQADWQYAHAAATLAAYCGLRACEIKGLQWKDVDFADGLLQIRRSKTPGGWRTPTLNAVCSDVLAGLYETARTNNATAPEHFVFPWQGGKGIVDPTRPMAGWRTAWRSILKEAGIKARFHDLRHTAVTTMAEAGLPDLTIMAQVGHVSPEMMKTYSHIRRQALNQAAAALQPDFPATQPVVEMVNYETMEVTKKRIDQIKRLRRYGLIIDGETIRGEPTQEEIAYSVDKNELEIRGLQQHWEELVEEWKRVPRLELPRVLRQYHARRIAFFWINGWTDKDVIKVCAHDVLEDGAHRFLSAKYKGESSIDCEIVKCNECGRV